MSSNIFSEFLIKYDITGNAHKEIKNLNSITKSTNKESDKLSKTISFLRRELAVTGVAFSVVVAGLTRLVDSTAQASANIVNLARESGISTNALQRLTNAYAGIANISTDQAQNDLSKLGKQLQEFKMGIGDPSNFAMAGINVSYNTTTEDVIHQLINNLSKLDDAKASVILNKLNLSNNLIYLIRASSEEIQRFSNIEVLSSDQIKNTIQMGTAFRALKLQLLAFKNKAIADIAPTLTESFKEFFTLITDNKDKVISFIKTFVNFFKDFAFGIMRATRFVAHFINTIFSTTKGMEILVFAIGALYVAMSPFLRVLTLITLVFDDIQAYLEGAPSLLGEFIKKFQDFNFIKQIGIGIGGIIVAMGLLSLTLSKFKIGSGIYMLITTLKTIPSIIRLVMASFIMLSRFLIANPYLLAISGIAIGAKKLYDIYNENKQNKNVVNQENTNDNPNDQNIVKTISQYAKSKQNEIQMTPIPMSQNNSVNNNNDNSNKKVEQIFNFNITGKNGEEIANNVLDAIRAENQKTFTETGFMFGR